MPSVAPAFTITPFQHAPGSKVTMGVEVRGVLINEIDTWPSETWDAIKNLVFHHKLVAFKSQGKLHPSNQLKLMERFSGGPAIGMHSLDPKKFQLRSGAPVFIPEVPVCQVVGVGKVPEGHYGIDGAVISQRTSKHLYKTPLTEEEIARGDVRLVQLHFDSALYEAEPPAVGSLYCVKKPVGPDVTLRFDTAQGSQGTMEIAPGATIYFDMAQLYDLLSPERKRIVDHSRVVYAPRAFSWMSSTHFTEDGASIYSEGKEMSLDDVPAWEEKHVKEYPMVWVNPVTQQKSLMIHGQAAWKLILKDGPDGEERVVDDLAEVRKFCYEMQLLSLKPEYAYAHDHQEEDCLIWLNIGLQHSATEFPFESDRVMHQINVSHCHGPEHPTRPDETTPVW